MRIPRPKAYHCETPNLKGRVVTEKKSRDNDGSKDPQVKRGDNKRQQAPIEKSTDGDVWR